METLADPSRVVLRPSADGTGHELTCSTCSARAEVRAGTPWLPQIRAFTRRHAH